MKYYVTTSIPYVNGQPHVGHAMEFVMADVLARTARNRGETVLFSTGTDEHGGKIAEKASELGVSPKELSDQMSQKFRDLIDALEVQPDRFIRTTDKGHEQRAQLIWKKLKDYIYKHTYTGWYCTGDEEFFTETQVKENKGICPDHNRPYEKIEEENYFFKLSAFTDKIRTAIDNDDFCIIPSTRRNEILSLLGSGLEDISISRPKDKIDWGIAVPGDPHQVMYVWFEALLNYITVLGYPEHKDFTTYWPADVQVIGKGILRFHAAIWPGILLALGLPLPKTLYVHGYVTVEGKKMSKSLGNSIDPINIITTYGADAFRYYFLRHVPSYDDGDYSQTTFEAAYNNELANELGNAVRRTAAMVLKYQNGIVGDIPAARHDVGEYRQLLAECRFDRALDSVWDKVRGLNQLIDTEKPWEIAKQADKDHLREILAQMVSDILQIADLLDPFIPKTTSIIRATFADGVVRPLGEPLFPRLDALKTNK
jgi:methionyl-tRNA synthetase